MKIYVILEECADPFYGFFPSEFFVNKVVAERRMKELEKINRGINYELGEEELNEETLD